MRDKHAVYFPPMPSPSIETLLPQHVAFSREMDLSLLLPGVPARWAVYLFLDTQGLPFQLLCVKNLRASLARRLGADRELAPGRTLPYRQVVGSISWQRVDSLLEADLAYAKALQAFFPHAYRQFIASRRGWFVQITPGAHFPTFTRTDEPRPAHGRRTFGPIPSRAASQKTIESLEDAFDLCRYPAILAQSPHGTACPYKQMHKCPAPCDGSVPLGLYCMQVDMALAFLASPASAIEAHTQRMQAAATALQFEQAGRIKAYVQQLQRLADARLRNMQDLQYLAVLRGPGAGTAKLLLASPWQMDELVCLRRATLEDCGRVAAMARDAAHRQTPWDAACLARLGILSQYLLHPMGDGILLPLHDLSGATLHARLQELARPAAQAPADDEGVMQDSV